MTSLEIDPRLETHRAALIGYCYRMLGSAFEAEDAVQETLVRAWRNFDRFDENRAPLRSWLYTIATNICLDMLRSTQRRARAMDLGPSSYAGAPLGAPLPETAWLQPIPDSLLPSHGDPAELAVARETIRLAFVAALQHLPPRQRAVLILRDVLCWQAREVAHLLGATVASVNSALQRARATLDARNRTPTEPFEPMNQAQRELLARYVDAFERYDVATLTSLLHEGAKMSMPPFTWWLQGPAEIGKAWLGAEGACHGSRLIPVVANGAPAFGQYAASGKPWALVIVGVSGGRIVELTSYLETERLFPLFGLPAVFPRDVAAGPMSSGAPRRTRS
jgi:RNA polymerase sigma-70 factor (ECF subfamily)